MRDLTTEVAEFRERLDAFQWDPNNAFPTMVGYVDIPCEHILKRTLKLVHVHADQIRAGNAPRISALCRALQLIACDSAGHGWQVYRNHQYIDGKPRADMGDARQQARWLGWLIRDALQAGRKSKGCETDLAVDVLGLIRELVQYVPWEKLPKDSLRHRVGLVRWFGEEVERITAPPWWRPSRPKDKPSQPYSVRSNPPGPLREIGNSVCTRSTAENA